MFSYVDVKDKIAITAKNMKYFAHKGEEITHDHSTHFKKCMCMHTQFFFSSQTFPLFLLTSSHKEHNIDQPCPSEFATGPQCGCGWGRAVWLQASGADGRPRCVAEGSSCFCQPEDINTIQK